MAIYPGAQWMPISGSSGSYTGGPFKIVHHTTEGSTAAGAFSAFRDHKSDPHFTVDSARIYQHIDTNVAARALRNPAGGVETNRDSAIQIEVVGFAHRPKAKVTLRNVAKLCRWLELKHGIPNVWPNGPPKPAVDGNDPGGHNRDAATWDSKGGHYGHSNVPENTHWDPGYTADEVEFIRSYTGTEGLAEGFVMIPEIDAGLESDYSRMPDHSDVNGAPSSGAFGGVRTGLDGAGGREAASPSVTPSVTQREESRSRLEALMTRFPGDAMAEVNRAIAERRIDPIRFGLAPEGVSTMERAGSGRAFALTGNEFGLEAIVRTVGRPPMLIRRDRVEYQPVPLLPQFTEAHARAVEKYIPSVGRVEFINHDMRWGGTGFVVDFAPGSRRKVVTNRHVAKLVARRASDGSGIFLRSPIGARYGAMLDMREEVDSAPGDEYALPVTRVIYLADDTEADIAVLEIEVREGVSPDPIPLAGRRGRDNELVATIGYPAFDTRNQLDPMRAYFQDLYDVKRFAPGLIMTGGEGSVLSHDCTTLGGNSGSCLLSLEQKAVVGLHFYGDYGVQNAAVSAQTLKGLLSEGHTVVGGIAPLTAGAEAVDGVHRPDQLADRPGYNAAFLGADLEVPWPEFGEAICRDLAVPSDALPGREYELRYTHFGVLYSAGRRSPRVTAVNIDGENAIRIKRSDDKWFTDLRIDAALQLGQIDYQDAEIDRGHMVRREDPNWGAEAERANFDTFHYTNSALQHSSLNQGKTLWQGLENYILDSARTAGFKACVFTGPVFRDDDPELPPSNARVPLEFWKIVVMPTPEGALHATGYVLSQGDLIRELLERRSRTEAVEGFVLGAYRTFQVAITHIEEVTGLSFPALRGADPLANAAGGGETLAAGSVGYRPLDSISDIILVAPVRAAAMPNRGDAALAEIEARVAALEPVAVLGRLIAVQDGIDDPARSNELSRLFQAYHREIVGSAVVKEEAKAPDYNAVKGGYQALYDSLTVRPDKKGEVAWYVKKLTLYRPRYEKVGAAIGIPWWFVGITHALEGSFNLNGHLHNGDPLGHRTVQVPKNRPVKWNPPNDWESSAVDALTYQGYAKQKDWSIPRALYRFEGYNGWGYRGGIGINTPYLWSFSNHYTRGKYTSDGHYDSSAVSKQCGAATMMIALGI
ncbi:DNA/RNA non-specific endonuclease [Mesorhizobium sp. LjNodule214]|uniref:DNA/RNA non-specific endonuclease n=1 Tax=Mesorhizobium sp. LjNodule214 TaxID=3342252 RepID=UPI003ECF800D